MYYRCTMREKPNGTYSAVVERLANSETWTRIVTTNFYPSHETARERAYTLAFDYHTSHHKQLPFSFT